MTYALLPAARVRHAAEMALEGFDPTAHGLDDGYAERRRSWFRGLIGLCCAVMVDPKAHHVIAVDPTDFIWIMRHYDFREPGVAGMEPKKLMEPMKPMEPLRPMKPMEPMKPLDFGPAWWPDNLGQPSTSGGQNDVKYAFFADKHRLAIQRDGKVTVYDSDDHQIAGVSQQQGSSSALAFISQHGTVNLDELHKL